MPIKLTLIQLVISVAALSGNNILDTEILARIAEFRAFLLLPFIAFFAAQVSNGIGKEQHYTL